MDKLIKKKIHKTIDVLKSCMEKTVYEVPEMKYIPCGYKKCGELAVPDETWQTFGRYDRLRGCDKHFWFSFDIETPKAAPDKEIVLEFITGYEGERGCLNPQGMLYLNGKLAQGIDVNHREVTLEPETKYNVLFYFYTGMEDGDTLAVMNLKEVDVLVKKLYYDMKIPYDAAMTFDEDDYVHIKTMKHLVKVCDILDFRRIGSEEFYKSAAAAEEYLKTEYYEKECGQSDAVVNYVGHTHIDVAWLWTLAQTKEKVQRSFSTVLRLMDKYPEYIFMSSQPQLYEYLKQEEPRLYEELKQKVKEGRWEVDGAMWLEADCNLSSGESLIRQILHGKKFIKDEFGIDSRILWLPDVFGYSAALPQILKKSGVDKFVTSKIGWNDTNKMPCDSFMWQGVDGTEIFTYFLTCQSHERYKANVTFTTYVGRVTPTMCLGTWERYQQKEYNNEVIVTFGWGDGGGGPDTDMLESYRRLQYGLPGLPKAQMSRVGDFLERVEKNFNENCEKTGLTPRWVGELYLELHRGTYTSMAKNKKNNRECEFLCQGSETLSVIDRLLLGGDYPAAILHDSWKILLLNQFHDIIPGSSIKEVYEDSDRQYAEVYKAVGAIKRDKLTTIASNVTERGVLVYNPNSFTASGYVKQGDEYVYAENIPAMGWKVINEAVAGSVSVTHKRIESSHYIISFNDDMNIISLFDKDNNREVVAEGKTVNQLRAFEDYPYEWDNWEIAGYYKQKMREINDVQSVDIISGNGYGGFRIVRRYMDSLITQSIIVYSESRRIDFETDLDWHQQHTLLKAAFPTTVHTSKATYEIQFGSVERPTHENTSWDKARFEVCAQKWGDLSEEGYGVSILNNCKYGHNAEGSEMSLTLLKCGTYPNTEADQGLHSFTYSLYPHKGSFKQGGTINEAYILNRPLEAIQTNGGGSLPAEYSLVSCDCENIIIETVKQAESGNGIIVRMYDAWDKKSAPTVKFGFDAKKVLLADMMENPIQELGSGTEVKLNVSNFEIVTLMIEI